MSKEINITGKRFGKLVAIKRTSKYKWLFKCDCGKEKEINKNAVIRGVTKSCGCIWYENVACGNKTHGLSETRLYECWRDMRNRCYREKTKGYDRYGGRGIKVCQDWKEHFEPFMNWALQNGYNDNLTLDRIDVNGNYSPENCKWSNRKEQALNRRTTIFVEYKGKKHSLKDWADIFDKPRTCWYNKYKGYKYEDVLKIWEQEKNGLVDF